MKSWRSRSRSRSSSSSTLNILCTDWTCYIVASNMCGMKKDKNLISHFTIQDKQLEECTSWTFENLYGNITCKIRIWKWKVWILFPRHLHQTPLHSSVGYTSRNFLFLIFLANSPFLCVTWTNTKMSSKKFWDPFLIRHALNFFWCEHFCKEKIITKAN